MVMLAFCVEAAPTAAKNHSPVAKRAEQAELLGSLLALRGHLTGATPLTDAQIGELKLKIDARHELMGADEATIKACLDVVATYDKVQGPLWVARDGFDRKKQPPANDIHWTVYGVMQDIMDRVYTPRNLATQRKLLDGFKFGCSAHFPGAVDPPADPAAAYTVKVNASCPKPFQHKILHQDHPARRPTGAYLAPGSIATVTVPKAIVGKGYGVRVGAQSCDFSQRPNVLRLDRSSLVYPIDSTEVLVASPMGGGIYLEVPLLANAAGVIEVTIRNAVRSPLFRVLPYHQTSLTEWKSVERERKAPWADFQTEKFMMQVPTSWISKLEDPVTLMQNWDKAMDALNDLMGTPQVWGKETMYLQVDLQMSHSVFAPGYPTCNDRYDPKREYDGYANHYLVRGPLSAPDYVFHEQGHGFLFPKFDGESESTVNLLHVAVWNEKFGVSLDEAFRASRGYNNNPNRTLDNTAVEWMACLSFAAKRPMEAGEKAYQLKGHAKFVDIVRLFGWQTLNDFWRSWTHDEDAGKGGPKNQDALNLRLSQQAGVDVTPLLHFWGTPPHDAAALKKAVASARLPASAKVYDELVHYQSLVPKNNQAFRDFALKLWGKQPSSKGFWTEREHAKQWDDYNEQTAAQIRDTVQEILDHYFPKGRPKDR